MEMKVLKAVYFLLQSTDCFDLHVALWQPWHHGLVSIFSKAYL